MEPDQQDPHGAINFGEFRKYMQNKQAKLKIQQKQLGELASQELDQIFKGTSIYINGYTDPPSSVLRKIILQHGGDYQHYLKKISVTHIIATNLTNSKLNEFRAYKVVTPNWITESVEKQQLLPWQNYRLVSKSTNQPELQFRQTGHTLNAGLLANDWARSVSTVNPEFIKRYYETSRLHYLSTWKVELKDIVEKLEKKYMKPKRHASERVVMHIDFDCFFASVGIKDRPHLKDKPVAVSHSKGASEVSSSDIASCNYVARSFGIHNGMMIGQAKSLCPELQVIPYEFEKYRAISEIFYEIIFQYADEIQSVSVDESLLEVGSYVPSGIESLATKLRDEIRTATGCETSIGIGPNILLARLSTKRAKPAGQYYCKTQQDIDTLLSNTNVIDLPGVGYAIKEKLNEMNITTVGDVRKLPMHQLQSKLGPKMGQTLYNFARGLDDRALVTNQPRQSVSAEVNWGVRFENDGNERTFVEGLAKEVSDRLKKHNVKGKTITVKILCRKVDAEEAMKNLGHGEVDSFSKSYTNSEYTDDASTINQHVYTMLKSFRFSSADIRGLGIQITRLDNQSTIALSPDQGKLNFEKKSHNVPYNNEAGSSKRRKQEMVVDYRVYQELPVFVQQELASDYTLKFQNEEQSTGKELNIPTVATSPKQEMSNTATSPQRDMPEMAVTDTAQTANLITTTDLPPWSQLAPSVLLDLPDKMREQLLRAYHHQRDRHVSKQPKLSPSPTNHNKRARTITQLLNSIPTLTDDIISSEVIEESKNKQTIVILNEEPMLEGETDLNTIRHLLKQWVLNGQPEPQDTRTVIDYLVQLVKLDLEKTHLILLYLKNLMDNEQWQACLKEITTSISNNMMVLYGASFYGEST